MISKLVSIWLLKTPKIPEYLFFSLYRKHYYLNLTMSPKTQRFWLY